MPGFDGTGPIGMGPRTGGGLGYCPPGSGPVLGPVYGLGRGGLPWGSGRGMGFGWGRGRGRRWWGLPYGYPAGAMPAAGYAAGPWVPAPEQERAVLQGQLDMLNQQVEAIQGRLREIETRAAEEPAK